MLPPAHPLRLHPGLQRDPTTRHRAEHFLHRFRSRAQFLFQDNEPASSSTQYQLDRSPRSSQTVNFCCEIFLLAFPATVLTSFIVGLLYLLRFERVDNLGAYSIPPETGLLIPSDCANNRLQSRLYRGVGLCHEQECLESSN